MFYRLLHCCCDKNWRYTV